MSNNDKRLRSEIWFNDPTDPGETAVYIERYTNYGITRQELQSGRPVIGIAQTGSDLVPCNRIHVPLAERVKAGIRDELPASDGGARPQPGVSGAGRSDVRLSIRWHRDDDGV